MNFDNTYNPVQRPTLWQRFQMRTWDKYGVDAGEMMGVMASAFAAVVVLGGAFVVQL